MRALVTGSAGHLGEALVRTLREPKHAVVGLDVLQSPFTTRVGSITDRSCVRRCIKDVQTAFQPAAICIRHRSPKVSSAKECVQSTLIQQKL